VYRGRGKLKGVHIMRGECRIGRPTFRRWLAVRSGAGPQGSNPLMAEPTQILGTGVAQFRALPWPPGRLERIQLGCVTGKLIQRPWPLGVGGAISRRAAAAPRQYLSDEAPRPIQVTQQVLEKGDPLECADGAADRTKAEAPPPDGSHGREVFPAKVTYTEVWSPPDGRDGREVFPAQGIGLHRCRWLNCMGLAALRFSMPYHDRRMIAAQERTDPGRAWRDSGAATMRAFAPSAVGDENDGRPWSNGRSGRPSAAHSTSGEPRPGNGVSVVGGAPASARAPGGEATTPAWRAGQKGVRLAAASWPGPSHFGRGPAERDLRTPSGPAKLASCPRPIDRGAR